MKITWIQAIKCLAVAVAVASPAARVSAQVAAPPDPTAAIANNPDVQGSIRLFSAWAEGQLRHRGLPGMAVGVVWDQQLVWSQGFGWADIAKQTPMTPQTRFRIASHSKLFTATAIMQLREGGRLRLDDPVTQYLPWFKTQPAGPDDTIITIEDLLTHSSGLPREMGDHWTSYRFPTADEIKAQVHTRQAAYAPETRWKYSNLAYTLAGMVVERVTGQSWGAYVQQRVFDPLAMKQSSVDRPDPQLATGYGRRMPDGSRSVMPFIDSKGMAAATGLSSSVEDLARFVSAQFRDKPAGAPAVLSDASLREMQRARFMEDDWGSGNGIGFIVSRNRGEVVIGHSGGYPGYITHTLISPSERIGVIVLTNSQDGDATAMATQLINSVGVAVSKAAGSKRKPLQWDPAWSRFTGLYRGRSSDTHVVELNQKLVLINPDRPTIDTRIELEPLGNDRFLYKAPTGGGPIGEVVRFVETGGRVLQMVIGDNAIERVRMQP